MTKHSLAVVILCAEKKRKLRKRKGKFEVVIMPCHVDQYAISCCIFISWSGDVGHRSKNTLYDDHAKFLTITESYHRLVRLSLVARS